MWETGNPASKHNFLKGRGLVSGAVLGFSTNGEIPGSAIKKKSMPGVKFCERRTCVLHGLFPRCLTEYQPRDSMFSANL
jgi:hypothetical protein